MKKDRSKKKRILQDRLFGLFAGSFNLFFAFWGGKVMAKHFCMIFVPNHEIDTEITLAIMGLLFVLMGVWGCYGSLGFLFEETKLEHVFPGFFNF